MSSAPIGLAIIETGTPPPELLPRFERYPAMFKRLFEPKFSVRIEESYAVFEGAQLPSPETHDAFLLTGSPASAYENLPWMVELSQWIRSCHSIRKPMAGICFGHQIIASALGGRVEKAPVGWGIGVRRFSLTQPAAWMPEAGETLALRFSHQDQVVELPPAAQLLGGDPFCPVQMYTVGGHIFCVQGHPEFSEEYMQALLEFRRDILPSDAYAEALRSLNDLCDGSRLATGISAFLAKSLSSSLGPGAK